MALNCKTPADVLKVIKENEVKYVDLRFTDPRGKWQHLTITSEFIDDDAFSDGIMFDGSSIAGWKAINESDMALMPDRGDRGDGSVRRAADADPVLRRGRAVDRRALPRDPALDRQEGGGLRRPRPASATPSISVRKPSSSSSTTCATK